VATLLRDKGIAVADGHSGERLFVFDTHFEDVTSVRFSHDVQGSRLVTAGRDNTVRLWNTDLDPLDPTDLKRLVRATPYELVDDELRRK
jgi:WD40 repeat protein